MPIYRRDDLALTILLVVMVIASVMLHGWF
jgi:hypothetical protein